MQRCCALPRPRLPRPRSPTGSALTCPNVTARRLLTLSALFLKEPRTPTTSTSLCRPANLPPRTPGNPLAAPLACSAMILSAYKRASHDPVVGSGCVPLGCFLPSRRHSHPSGVETALLVGPHRIVYAVVVDPPLPQVPNAQNLSPDGSLVDPLALPAEWPRCLRCSRLLRTPRRHCERERLQVHSSFHPPFRFCHRVDTKAVAVAEFMTETTADILVNK